MKPIIFLDVDDVLAISREFTSYQVMATFKSGDLDAWPELWDGLLCAEACRNLAALHREFDALYVISSSWSHYLTRDQMREVFDRCQLSFVAKNMHEAWTTPKRSGWSRYDEIHSWTINHLEAGCPVLVLDDEQSGASLRGSSLYARDLIVLCEPWVGFSAERLSEAQRLLRAQSN
ncbi:HAD domain-containing protein [Massilia antarctica]|uniref:HAD domain-containing protein n=1 Tax=Massilia antarctica TaxID=2765360 RepID=UPI0006BB927E|nr:HAD domain-containing protein [Massilia sp. H27-R4]MCY0910297.1 HAD domain-containing protein [Massilia sp. H27-R4]